MTGEAQLVDFTRSEVGGNIDPLQMSELPVSGRGWQTLALLAPGNRTTAIGADPVQEQRHDNREFQLNVDGVQVTNNLGTGAQPRFNRDTIGEFQFLSNRFDATQGRSTGVQVNAITRSGSNTFSGQFGGYFRHDRFNAEDHVLGIVRPINIQQYSATGGGPILRDRLHFFGSYELEREPKTSIWNTPWEEFNITLDGDADVKVGSGRVDYQISPNARLMARVNRSKAFEPFGGGSGSNHPASTATDDETTGSEVLEFTTVLSNRALNTIRVSHADYKHGNQNLTRWADHPNAGPATRDGVALGSPRIFLRGFNVTGNSNFPRFRVQDTYAIRNDFTYSYDARGRHDLRAGGEFLYDTSVTANCSFCMGRLFARGGPVPDNLPEILPVWDDAGTWNLDALAPVAQRFEIGVAETFPINVQMWKYGLWLQDDWQVSDRLTLNLGVRYDLIWNAFEQQAGIEPWQAAGRPQDADNIQPRLGFAYRMDDRTVIRGGAGRFYADIIIATLNWPKFPEQIRFISVENDGRPDFPSNPFNGPVPTLAEADQLFCHVNDGAPGCLELSTRELAPPEGMDNITNKWHFSVGVQRQIGNNVGLDLDYIYQRGLDEKVIFDNVNVTFDPATGRERGFSNPANRVDPLWANIGMSVNTGWSNYHALQTSLRKRMSDNWQANLTYTLSGFWTGDPPPLSGTQQVTFPVALDLGNDYSLGPNDQRHRLVLNSIWQVGYGFQVSGLYFYGSGERQNVGCGCDLPDLGPGGPDRLMPDGSILPRASFVGTPIHRVDVRLQQRVPVGGGVRVDGILEMFNLFNRANFGSFETERTSLRFGEPNQSANIAYGPFTMQLGFRVSF